MPYTRNSTPTKNHSGMISFFSLMSSPENNLQHDQQGHRDATPEDWPMQQSDTVLVGHFRQAVDQSFQFGVGPRLRYHRDQQRDPHARYTRPQRLVHILRHATAVRCNSDNG